MTRQNLALCGIITIAFVSFLDYTLINTALPVLQQYFQVSILELQWVFNIYCIAMAVFMVIFGRIGDKFGRRRVFYIGAFTLAIGSLGAGLSQVFIELLFFRGIQSLGVAATVTLGASLITSIFKERAQRPMSIYISITGLALALGPFIGGIIVTHLGWRAIFLINLPIIILGYFLCAKSVAESKSEQRLYLDWQGVVLFAITLSAFIYGLICGEAIAWTSKPTIISLALSLILLPLLLYVEKKQEWPILSFHFFRIPGFALAALVCVMAGCLISPTIFFAPLFLQNIFFLSPKHAGFILLALPIAIVFCTPVVSKLISKVGKTITLLSGLAVGLVSSIIMIVFSLYSSLAVGLTGFILIGLAWTITNVTAPISAAQSVDSDHQSIAIGTVLSLWNAAAAIMIAGTTLIYHVFRFKAGTLPFQAVFILIGLVMLILTCIGFIVALKYRK